MDTNPASMPLSPTGASSEATPSETAAVSTNARAPTAHDDPDATYAT